MKHSNLFPRAGSFQFLTLSVWLFLAIAAHAQPGPGFALRFADTSSYCANSNLCY